MKSHLFNALLFLSLLGSSGAGTAGAAAADSRLPTGAQLDAMIDRARTTFDVPGIAVVVVKDGNVVYLQGRGQRSINSDLPVDENTSTQRWTSPPSPNERWN